MTSRGRLRTCGMLLLCMAMVVLPISIHASQTKVTIRGGEQHASSGNWDTGSLTLTIDGHTETVSFGQFSTVQSVASGLAAKFSLDCNSPVQAHAIGSVITFTTKRMDVSFEQVSAASVWDTADFTHASFGIAQPQAPPTLLTPSLALSCTPNPIPAGGSADCTASLPKGATGTVNFAIDGQPAWSTADVDGTGWAPASTISGLTIGSHTLSATYSGDSQYNTASQTLPLPVGSGALVSSTVYSYSIVQADGATSGYAPNGNIVAYTDSVNGNWGWQSGAPLQYDGLSRLVGGSSLPAGSSTTRYWCWAYDSFGNRTVEASSSYSFGGVCPTNGTEVSSHAFDATNKITGDAQIQYDAAGNTTADHDNSYLYDGDGRVCAVNNGLVMTQYIYDAGGTRVAKGTITTFSCDMTSNGFQPTTSYVLGQSGEQVTEMSINFGQATWAHTNVYAGGMLVATYDPLGLHFQLTDWLGSRRVQTNAFGQIEETCVNSPFGNGLVCSSPNGAPSTADDATEHHFTGKERDAESGLDYFGARFYASTTGRWMSPDWALKPEAVPYSSLGDPQSLNLYGYVGNNPLSKADADGHCYFMVAYCAVQAAIQGIKRDGGVKAYAKNVVIGVAKGAGQTAINLATPTPVAIFGHTPHPKALQPTNQSQAQASEATQLLLPAAATAGAGALAGAASGAGAVGAGSGIGATGAIGESWLANNLGGDSQVFFQTSQGARYVDQLADGIAYESKVGYTCLTSCVAAQISKDAELVGTGQVDGAEWHFFPSPVTGQSGPSAPLANALTNANIPYVVH